VVVEVDLMALVQGQVILLPLAQLKVRMVELDEVLKVVLLLVVVAVVLQLLVPILLVQQ
tara:strand:+ start:319 stop:495 length:177 start_codon:yes stop_codon:yes gene_type:complete